MLTKIESAILLKIFLKAFQVFTDICTAFPEGPDLTYEISHLNHTNNGCLEHQYQTRLICSFSFILLRPSLGGRQSRNNCPHFVEDKIEAQAL